MGSEGFLCSMISPDYGGMGGDFHYSVIVLEEIARTNFYGIKHKNRRERNDKNH